MKTMKSTFLLALVIILLPFCSKAQETTTIEVDAWAYITNDSPQRGYSVDVMVMMSPAAEHDLHAQIDVYTGGGQYVFSTMCVIPAGSPYIIKSLRFPLTHGSEGKLMAWCDYLVIKSPWCTAGPNYNIIFTGH